jgi:probable addiction module antidote protein
MTALGKGCFLGDIARARGMPQVANDSGIIRKALYKALQARP